MSVLEEIRLAVRRLAKSPVFSLIAVLTLGLGIGVNSTVFSLISGILLRPLPYDQPERLVAIWDELPALDLPQLPLSGPEVIELRDQSRLFSGVAAFRAPIEGTLTGEREPIRLTGVRATPDFFQVLGVSACLGRVFTPDDGTPGRAADVVVLSQALFLERFGGDPAILGKTLHLDDLPYTVVGVLPADVRFPAAEAQFWLPLILKGPMLSNRGSHNFKAIARLQPGVPLEQARAEMATRAKRLQQEYPHLYPLESGWNIGLVPLREEIAGRARPVLFLLAAAAALVLILTCANLAHLMLLRAEGRQGEIGIRIVFGAAQRQVRRTFLAESLVLALGGCLLALLIVPMALEVFRFWNPENLPYLDQVTVDARVLVFTLAVAVTTALIFGSAPGRIARLDLRHALSAESRRTTVDPRRRRLRNLLVVLEIAVSFLLLSGAALLLRSFWNVQSISTGLKPSGVLTFKVAPSRSRYREGRQLILHEQLRSELAALPGVASVGAVSALPMAEQNFDWSFEIEGRPVAPGQPGPTGDYQLVLPGYFETLGVQVVRGRSLGTRDDARAIPALVIDETMAQRYWPNENPVGKRIRLGVTKTWVTIVGVVKDVRHQGLEAEPRAENTFTLAQFPAIADTAPLTLTFVMRASAGKAPLALMPSVRRAIWSVDPSIAISQVATMESVVEASLSGRRFSLWLFVTFAALALILAALGTYGVISYNMAQRTREIGIRMALGTTRGELLRLVLRQGLAPVLAGLAVGFASALALGRLVSSFLYEVQPTDAVSLASVAFVLLGVATLAVVIPARRAVSMDPAFALYHE